MEILKVDHDKWQEFIAELSILVGPPEASRCKGDLAMTRATLETMGFDIEPTIKDLQGHSAFCDCEVLMNLNVVDEE